MPFFILLVGVVIIIAAFNNTHSDLAHALQHDMAGFFPWAAAIGIILSLGFIPGMKIPARWLLALVAVVIVVKNYQVIISGVTDFTKTAAAQTGEGTPAPVPTSSFTGDPNTSTLPTPQQISGSSDNAVQPSPDLMEAALLNPLNPSSYVTAALEGFGAGHLMGI